MSFSSSDFIVFAVIVLSVYYLSPHRVQNVWLLAASLFFYAFVHLWYLWLVLASTAASFIGGLGIQRYPTYRRHFLAAGLVVCFGILAMFKYCDFFIANMDVALRTLGFGSSLHLLNLALPVGISFYTFQAASYLIDVYRGKVAARRNLLNFALFKMFFPQLTAGPIERANDLLVQIERKRVVTAEHLYTGVTLLVWGFFKKLVIADNVSPIADKIFNLNDPSIVLLATGVFAFAIQIFADFSGYTDIARGISALMGFRLVRNFNHPYFSTSPIDFWRRWHISLSEWFRDYVYIPLGGSRVSFPRQIANLLATFTLSGFWHGASWNFVLWGLYHGALVTIQHALQHFVPAWRDEMPGWTYVPRVVLTFVLVNIGWLLFRETDIAWIGRYLTLSPFSASAEDIMVARYLFALTVIYSIPIWVHGIYDQLHLSPRIVTVQRYAMPFVIGTLFLATRALGILGQSGFIYFQF